MSLERQTIKTSLLPETENSFYLKAPSWLTIRKGETGSSYLGCAASIAIMVAGALLVRYGIDSYLPIPIIAGAGLCLLGLLSLRTTHL